MKANTGQSYRRRLTKVIDYMYENISGDLDVNTLADIANMSPYHFHRIYREMAQENINATVRRMRLQQAAAELIKDEWPLAKIATSVGYQSLEAFSRAFSKQFGETPSDYRKARSGKALNLQPYVAMLPTEPSEYVEMFEVEVLDFDGLNLLGYEHQGDYLDIGKAFEKIFQYAGIKNLLREESRSFGLYYHDPKTVTTEELRSVASVSVANEVELSDEDAPEFIAIPKGKCATLLFKGSYAELEKPYDWFFGEWLPKSGHEAADFPPFEEYLNDPKTTAPNELLTRIHCLLA